MQRQFIRSRPSSGHRLAAACSLLGTLLVAFTHSASAQRSLHSASLEEASAIAEQLLREREDPVLAALERVEEKRRLALDTESAIALAGTPARAGEQPLDRAHSSFELFGEYANSVALLAHVPDRRTLPALEEAARSSDAAVRHAAMLALREGASAGHPHSQALVMAHSAVLGDPDPRVRRQAFEAFRRWGSEDEVLALSQQLARVSGPVRDLAVREWIRIEQERSAQ